MSTEDKVPNREQIQDILNKHSNREKAEAAVAQFMIDNFDMTPEERAKVLTDLDSYQ